MRDKHYKVTFYMDNRNEITWENPISLEEKKFTIKMFEKKQVVSCDECSIDLSKCMLIKFEEEEE